ncbi:MAG: hypothetical protein Q7S06_00725 [Nanoarchaeota archaeon]|nr:hypothetical protein [Nanoarchaeota archaeon]
MTDLSVIFSTFIWIGVIIVILDFLLLYFKKDKPNTLLDYLLTAIGSGFILLGSIYNRLWALIVLNSFWVGMSILQIIKLKSRKKKRR